MTNIQAVICVTLAMQNAMMRGAQYGAIGVPNCQSILHAATESEADITEAVRTYEPAAKIARERGWL